MANELVHGSVGTELTQAEWEGVGTHVFNSQATGDIVYASSSSQLSRLAKGTDTHVLILSSGVPAWSTSTGITAVGTIATGTWQGTTIAVNQGGTGATSLSNLITLTTMTTGNYVATVTGGTGITSSGATSGEGIAHSLSVDASQTQITAVGTIATGVWQGTDVGVAYGGTGVSTLASNAVLTGTGASAITAESNLTFTGSLLTVTGDVTIAGTTPTLTIGDAGDEDTGIVFAGHGATYHIGFDSGTDDLVIGKDAVLGTTPAIQINSDLHIGFGGAPDAFDMVRFNAPAVTITDDNDALARVHIIFTDSITLAGTATPPVVTALRVNEPYIELTGGSSSVVIGATVYVRGIPTEGTSNYGFLVDHRSGDEIAYGGQDTYRINTGLTTATAGFDVNTGDYWTLGPIGLTADANLSGGMEQQILMENGSLSTVYETSVYGGTAATNKSAASSRSLIELNAYAHNGSNALADVTDDGNVFGVRCYTGSALATLFMVDENADLHARVANTVIALTDSYDDAQLVRAFDHAKTSIGVKGMIKDKWDDFVNYNEQDLIDAGVIGDTMENGGLLNVTGLQKLHNGAIWQGYTRQMEMQEKIDTLESRLLAIEGA